MQHPEAFTIGSNFKLSRLKEFDYDDDIPPMNAFVMWEPPIPNTSYTIGVDPSWGVGKDRAAIHILKNGTVKNEDIQVGEFCSDELNVHELTPICYMLGSMYNNSAEGLEALMSVECNISDDIVQQLRNNYNYSNLFIWKYYDNIKNQLSNKLGWWTNARTRPKIIIKGVNYIKNGWWKIRSPWTLNELATIEKLDDNAKVQAAAGHFDDLAFAGLIALWSAHDMEFSEFGVVEEIAKQRDRRMTTIIEAYNEPLQPLDKRKDFINTACSYEDMMRWDIGG